MALANQFDATRYYVGLIEDHGTLPNNTSYDPLPPTPWGYNWPQHIEGKGFVLVEDHRARPAEQFGKNLAQEATPWWLPDDKLGTPARGNESGRPATYGYPAQNAETAAGRCQVYQTATDKRRL